MSWLSSALNKAGIPKSVTSAGTAVLRGVASAVPGGSLIQQAGQAFDSMNKGKTVSQIYQETQSNIRTAVNVGTTAGQAVLDAQQQYAQASTGLSMFFNTPAGLVAVVVLVVLLSRGGK